MRRLNLDFALSPLREIDWRSKAEVEACTLGACREIAILLRRTISGHLRRSLRELSLQTRRLETILNVLQRIRLGFFHACGLASGPPSIRLVTKAFSDRLLGRVPNNRGEERVRIVQSSAFDLVI